MPPADVSGESPLDFRHARLGPSTGVKQGQNCIILGPKSANFPLHRSPMESVRLVHIVRGKPVLAHAGPHLIAVLLPFCLGLPAIYMNANINKKYREHTWRY